MEHYIHGQNKHTYRATKNTQKKGGIEGIRLGAPWCFPSLLLCLPCCVFFWGGSVFNCVCFHSFYFMSGALGVARSRCIRSLVDVIRSSAAEWGPQLEKGREAFVTAEASHENRQSRLLLFVCWLCCAGTCGGSCVGGGEAARGTSILHQGVRLWGELRCCWQDVKKIFLLLFCVLARRLDVARVGKKNGFFSFFFPQRGVFFVFFS